MVPFAPHRMKIKRVILNPGHGMNNATPGVFDPGATADGFEEAQIVRGLCSAVAVMRLGEMSAIVTPPGLPLEDVIRWTNERYRVGDLILSVHMNDGGGTGVECLHADGAKQERVAQASAMSATVAKRLGLADRGAKSDAESRRRRLGILRKTKAPALMLEIGFIDNANDRAKVMSHGAAAITRGLLALSLL